MKKALSTTSSSLLTALTLLPRRYYVLMIVTDGVITDMQETISTIVAASDLVSAMLITKHSPLQVMSHS